MTNLPTLKISGPPVNDAMCVTSLGGLDEVGRNMTVFELGGKLLIADCGVLFPEEDRLGADLIFPDFSSIEHRIDGVVALVLTHGHEDHIGGVPYLLRLRDDIPLVGSGLTLTLVEAKPEEHRTRLVLCQVTEHGEVSYGPFDLELAAVNHPIPDAMAVMIRTDAGNVLATGDFKMDSPSIDGHITDLRSFVRFGKEGVDLFYVDSTNAEAPGMVGHKDETGQVLNNVSADSDGQIVMASFASHVHRAQQVLDAAALHDRRVALVGRSMVRNMGIAAERGYLKVPAGILIDARDITSLPPHGRASMVTGSRGEPMTALPWIAHSERRSVTIEPGDTVIFASPLIPGNENSVFRVINQLMRLGAHVTHQGNAKVHVSGHASSEELLHIYNIAQPRNVMPIHGEIRHLMANGGLAVKTGIAPERVMLCEDDVAVDLEGGVARIAGQVSYGYIYADGSLVGEIDEAELKDRRILAEESLVSVYAVAETTTGTILVGLHTQARGVVEDDSVLEGTFPDVTEALSAVLETGKADAYPLQQITRRTLGRQIGRRLRRRPTIVPAVIETQEEGAHCMTLFRSACSISTRSTLIDIPLHVSSVPTLGGAIAGASSGPVVGGGYTVVSAAARQGIPTALVATPGTGPNSARVRESMWLDRVELFVEEFAGDIGTCATPIEPSGRRTSTTTAGVEGEPQREDLGGIDPRAGDWVYAMGYGLARYTSRGIPADWLLPIPDGVGLVIDPGPAQPDIPDQVLLPLLRRATILAGNDLEVGHLEERLGGIGAIRQTCSEVLIARRTGVNGCVLHSIGDEPIEVLDFAREAMDTTGVGGVHTGVLVADLLGGLDVVEAARRANAAVTYAVARSGPVWAPLYEEVDEFSCADDERS